MISYTCTIQEGVISPEQRSELRENLIQIGSSYLGVAQDDITVEFEIIPRGFGFRGGEISTSSSVRGRIPDGHSQETRVQFMQAVQDMWIRVTGQTTAELVVGAADYSYKYHQD